MAPLLSLVEAGKVTLDGLDRISIDDVAEFLDYAEAASELRERQEARQQLRRAEEARGAKK